MAIDSIRPSPNSWISSPSSLLFYVHLVGAIDGWVDDVLLLEVMQIIVSLEPLNDPCENGVEISAVITV